MKSLISLFGIVFDFLKSLLLGALIVNIGWVSALAQSKGSASEVPLRVGLFGLTLEGSAVPHNVTGGVAEGPIEVVNEPTINWPEWFHVEWIELIANHEGAIVGYDLTAEGFQGAAGQDFIRIQELLALIEHHGAQKKYSAMMTSLRNIRDVLLAWNVLEAELQPTLDEFIAVGDDKLNRRLLLDIIKMKFRESFMKFDAEFLVVLLNQVLRINKLNPAYNRYYDRIECLIQLIWSQDSNFKETVDSYRTENAFYLFLNKLFSVKEKGFLTTGWLYLDDYQLSIQTAAVQWLRTLGVNCLIKMHGLFRQFMQELIGIDSLNTRWNNRVSNFMITFLENMISNYQKPVGFLKPVTGEKPVSKQLERDLTSTDWINGSGGYSSSDEEDEDGQPLSVHYIVASMRLGEEPKKRPLFKQAFKQVTEAAAEKQQQPVVTAMRIFQEGYPLMSYLNVQDDGFNERGFERLGAYKTYEALWAILNVLFEKYGHFLRSANPEVAEAQINRLTTMLYQRVQSEEIMGISEMSIIAQLRLLYAMSSVSSSDDDSSSGDFSEEDDYYDDADFPGDDAETIE